MQDECPSSLPYRDLAKKGFPYTELTSRVGASPFIPTHRARIFSVEQRRLTGSRRLGPVQVANQGQAGPEFTRGRRSGQAQNLGGLVGTKRPELASAAKATRGRTMELTNGRISLEVNRRRSHRHRPLLAVDRSGLEIIVKYKSL
jgi:hypothetical protein